MRLKFGSWEVDTNRRLLTHGGSPASLSPKAFDLLVVLARHHEKAFSKAELHQILWPDTFVSDGSLTILVAEIRDVLNDDAEQPQFIRTVRRFGYGFCAPVTAQDVSPLPSLSGGGGWVIWGNRSIAIGRTECVLGRSLDADIRFDVPGVSRRHARIVVDGEHVALEDLGSQNGTYLRGERIIGRAALTDGDEVRLGPVSIIFRQVSADGSTLPMQLARNNQRRALPLTFPVQLQLALQENLATLPPDTPPTRAVFAQTPMRFFWRTVDMNYAVPFTMWNGVVERIPNATLRMFEHSGHQVFFEEPTKFAEAVLGWVSASDTPV